MSNKYGTKDAAVDTENTDESYLKSAEIELQDLHRYWSDLIWWEREASLHNVSESLSKIKEPKYAFRCGLAQDIAAELSNEKEQDYPADDDEDIILMGNPRLNCGPCKDSLKRLQDEDILCIASNLGLKHAEDHLEALFVAMDRSTAAFFTIRNKVGDFIRQANMNSRIS